MELNENPPRAFAAFLLEAGIEGLRHTGGTYMAHLVAVYRDLGEWGCSPDVRAAGMFHSIYGTEIFKDFALPLSRRRDLEDLIGRRAELLAYSNCAMDRASFDQAVLAGVPPHLFRDRWTGHPIELGKEDFRDLAVIHLADRLEQVGRSGAWNYRAEAYRRLADWLGPAAAERFRCVYARTL